MKIFLIFLATITIATNPAFAQGTAVNASGAAADSSAILDVSSTTKGQLIPRMTVLQRNSIISPAEALLIYNITNQCFEAFNSQTSQWVSFGCIGCQLPGAFAAASASGITQNSFTANWTVSSAATTYYLDVAADTGFAGFVTGYNNFNAGNNLSCNVAGLSCNNTYYYRVRSSNNCGTVTNTNTVTATTSACFTCGSTMTDSRDSKNYSTVQLGAQCWMSQNLDYGSYVTLATGQGAAGTQKYCTNLGSVNDPACPMGGLYEWAEIMNTAAGCNGTDAGQPACTTPVQGICPDGWHIPSHYEFTVLENYINNSAVFPYDVVTQDWLGTDEGGKMKVTPICGTLPCWNTPNSGASNSTGFSAIPGGCTESGSFNNQGNFGYWWSSTDSGTDAWARIMRYSEARVSRNTTGKFRGFSLRCIKD